MVCHKKLHGLKPKEMTIEKSNLSKRDKDGQLVVTQLTQYTNVPYDKKGQKVVCSIDLSSTNPSHTKTVHNLIVLDLSVQYPDIHLCVDFLESILNELNDNDKLGLMIVTTEKFEMAIPSTSMNSLGKRLFSQVFSTITSTSITGIESKSLLLEGIASAIDQLSADCVCNCDSKTVLVISGGRMGSDEKVIQLELANMQQIILSATKNTAKNVVVSSTNFSSCKKYQKYLSQLALYGNGKYINASQFSSVQKRLKFISSFCGIHVASHQNVQILCSANDGIRIDKIMTSYPVHGVIGRNETFCIMCGDMYWGKSIGSILVVVELPMLTSPLELQQMMKVQINYDNVSKSKPGAQTNSYTLCRKNTLIPSKHYGILKEAFLTSTLCGLLDKANRLVQSQKEEFKAASILPFQKSFEKTIGEDENRSILFKLMENACLGMTFKESSLVYRNDRVAIKSVVKALFNKYKAK